MSDFNITLQNILNSLLENTLLENLNIFIFPNLKYIIPLFVFWLLFSRFFNNRPKKEYPSFAKELEREEVSIEDLLATYLEAPIEEEEVVEVAAEIVPAAPPPAAVPTEVVEETEATIEEPQAKKTRKRKKRVARRSAFIFNAKEAIIYNTILNKKY